MQWETQWNRLLMLALVGWTVVGVVGSWVSLRRGEREQARRGVRWIAAVWAVYVAVLAAVSFIQPQRVVPLGKDQCFGEICFAVVGVEQPPLYAGRLPSEAAHESRLVRVAVRVTNHGQSPDDEAGIRAYLLDAQGRRWEPLPGLAGVRLTARITGGGTVVSEPVFKVAADASGLELVLTHGHWPGGWLVIGGPESWWHKKTVVRLGI